MYYTRSAEDVMMTSSCVVWKSERLTRGRKIGSPGLYLSREVE
jgi:hypothetical protein